MTEDLINIIEAEIKKRGAIPIDDFMSLALTHPQYGYYMQDDVLGHAGDFITAPEISQMFGELLGLWGYNQLLQQDRLSTAGFFELGAGRGVLMADAMRAIAPLINEKNWAVHLLEISPYFSAQQKKRLAKYSITHHSDLKNIPHRPLIFIANEFFDALPIKQFERQNCQWYERLITCSDGFKIKTASTPTPLDLPNLNDIENGTIAEIATSLPDIITPIARHIAQYGGGGIFIDYGKNNGLGDSLQAVQNHQAVDFLARPGAADLSAHVNFSSIAHIAEKEGLCVFPPINQGDFLRQCGLYERAETLSQKASPQTRRQLLAAVDRLTSPAQMGDLFKVLILLPTDNEI